jgi:hypothetical protein
MITFTSGRIGAGMSFPVLFGRKRSIYKSLSCDVYDEARDARNYAGSLPVIAHPPCRGWGRFHHVAKTQPGELQLAIFAIGVIRSVGGVLEHPKDSKLWPAGGLPPPGESDAFGGFTLYIEQSWFGHLAPKPTWLYICGISKSELPPFVADMTVATGRIENMCKAQRESTPLHLAEWLVQITAAIHLKKLRGMGCKAHVDSDVTNYMLSTASESLEVTPTVAAPCKTAFELRSYCCGSVHGSGGTGRPDKAKPAGRREAPLNLYLGHLRNTAAETRKN